MIHLTVIIPPKQMQIKVQWMHSIFLVLGIQLAVTVPPKQMQIKVQWMHSIFLVLGIQPTQVAMTCLVRYLRRRKITHRRV